MKDYFDNTPWEKKLQESRPRVWKIQSVRREKWVKSWSENELYAQISCVCVVGIAALLFLFFGHHLDVLYGFSIPILLTGLVMEARACCVIDIHQFNRLERETKNNEILKKCLVQWYAENRLITVKQYPKILKWIKEWEKHRAGQSIMETYWNKSELKNEVERACLAKQIPDAQCEPRPNRL